jgi:hypothetical protein
MKSKIEKKMNSKLILIILVLVNTIDSISMSDEFEDQPKIYSKTIKPNFLNEFDGMKFGILGLPRHRLGKRYPFRFGYRKQVEESDEPNKFSFEELF